MEIDKENNGIAFNDKAHKYWDVNDSKKKFISVTTLIEKFGQPFNKDFWSAYKALERLIPAESWKVEKKSLLNTLYLYSPYRYLITVGEKRDNPQ